MITFLLPPPPPQADSLGPHHDSEPPSPGQPAAVQRGERGGDRAVRGRQVQTLQEDQI